MKKMLFIAAVAVFCTTSCGKDRTCTCTSDSPGAKSHTTTLVGVSKGQAKANCVTTKTEFNGTTSTNTCKLN